jgi:SAM-dependent methyltransferase
MSAELGSAAQYVRDITSNASDRRYRSAFQALALQLAPAGSAVFDFGCGPGLDARFYAEHGLRVCAFDTDPAMCEYLTGQCREFLASGALVLQRGGYREFLGAAPPGAVGGVALIAANFAPLNLIDDLSELFARFDTLAAPGGVVLASVLSPYFAGDLRYRWWWRNAARLLRAGRYAVPGARSLIWRRRLGDFATQCAPHFRLAAVFSGHGTRLPQRGAWLRLTRSRYMFLLFRRVSEPAAVAGLPQPRLARRA